MSHSILENGRVLSAPSLHRESTDSLIYKGSTVVTLQLRMGWPREDPEKIRIQGFEPGSGPSDYLSDTLTTVLLDLWWKRSVRLMLISAFNPHRNA